ncbi:MAG: hypothetical protein ABSF70_10900 [Terracidiphilus sp.]|jgi:hypothetical protein
MATALQQPEVGNGQLSEDARRQREQARTERERQIQALKLQRGYILSQDTSNPARRAALAAALAQIEGQIQAIN